ncbi:hypothetical protein [Aureispira anguillae]|uniref:Uncharacterized protein n=1 Tax=Aureispira anguillae TaxID=2864201 RepID=A0A915YGC1_9BACT|nr:hypothetical protein [Aureispira anguillae]BDS12650.1 hypothetical protein AsAng_0033740 [Aureispira anguillae]
MNKFMYCLGGAILTCLIYFTYPQPSAPKTAPILAQKKTNKHYAPVGLGYKDSLVGTYQIVNSKHTKDLILDSTYTYNYSIQEGNESIVLEGTWELSYKDQTQHIILHRPNFQPRASLPKLADFEERKFKVTPDGLKDILHNESYLHIATDEYSLAIYE